MTTAATATTWDRLASRYARQERLESRAIQTALRLAAPARHERLVDLATGTGLLLRQLAACPTPPCEAIGVDRSKGMLARVGPLPESWSTLLANAQDVPLPDGCANRRHLLVPAATPHATRALRRATRGAPATGTRCKRAPHNRDRLARPPPAPWATLTGWHAVACPDSARCLGRLEATRSHHRSDRRRVLHHASGSPAASRLSIARTRRQGEQRQ